MNIENVSITNNISETESLYTGPKNVNMKTQTAYLSILFTIIAITPEEHSVFQKQINLTK